MADELKHVDLAFIVDVTGSMGTFIGEARRHLISVLQSLTASAGEPVDLRLAVVEYRDHPPEDHTFVARAHPFVADLTRGQKIIDGLKPEGGGDGPEAVYDGLHAACEQLKWRPHSRRLAVLVGDAPPHGTGAGGDHFRDGCPCGMTVESVTARMEQEGITLFALGLTRCVNASFGQLATFTGGEYFEAGQAQQAIEALQRLLASEFEGLHLDRRVLEACRGTPDWTVDGVGEALETSRQRVACSLNRLGRRGLLPVPARTAK